MTCYFFLQQQRILRYSPFSFPDTLDFIKTLHILNTTRFDTGRS